MGTSNKEFRFGTIAGIRPGFGFRFFYTFPFFNHLKYFPGLPEAIALLHHKLVLKHKKEVHNAREKKG